MKFIIDYKLDNWNDTINKCRYNKYSANSHKKKEMNIIGEMIQGLPKIEKYPIEMIFTWHIKSVNSDLDNKSVKNILDEMQRVGILENDNIKHIKKITHVAIKDSNDWVEVEIKEING